MLMKFLCDNEFLLVLLFFWGVLFENRPALYFSNYKKIIHVCWIPYSLMILLTLWSNIFIIRIIIANARKETQPKKLNTTKETKHNRSNRLD